MDRKASRLHEQMRYLISARRLVIICTVVQAGIVMDGKSRRGEREGQRKVAFKQS